MQIVETLNEGLKRAFSITIPAADVDARVDQQIRKMAPTMRMPGFRPGKVPPNLVRKMHGEALHGEALAVGGGQGAVAPGGAERQRVVVVHHRLARRLQRRLAQDPAGLQRLDDELVGRLGTDHAGERCERHTRP